MTSQNLPFPLMKDNGYEETNWKIRDEELSDDEIRVSIKDRRPSSMRVSWKITKRMIVP